MIISKIEYGLGNQLFQYALGRRIAEEKKETLFLDLSWYEKFDDKNGLTKREFLLNNFNTNFQKYNSSTAYRFEKKGVFKKILLKIRKINHRLYLKTGLFESWAFRQSGLNPINEAIKTKKDIYLKGEWLTEALISPIQNILQKELTLKTKPNKTNKLLLDQINNSNSVLVHIRRGDYVAKRMHDLGGICTEKYFNEAIALIEDKINAPHFYVFSDDINWARNAFGETKFTYISGNENTPEEDLRLMMSCKHAIISNSTFSWWGAWLIKNSDKVVICPSIWNKQKKHLIDNLIPNNWHKIKINE